jgi:hypothetical protein
MTTRENKSSSVSEDAQIQALRALVAKWRDQAERHKTHGDCYRIGEGWGINECADELDALLASSAPLVEQWRPIETAPKGSWPDGPDDTRDPAYVAPPHLWLTLPDGQRCVGSFDAYYAEGGNGYDGDSPWVEEFSSERVRPTHWMPLPSPPVERQQTEEE